MPRLWSAAAMAGGVLAWAAAGCSSEATTSESRAPNAGEAAVQRVQALFGGFHTRRRVSGAAAKLRVELPDRADGVMLIQEPLKGMTVSVRLMGARSDAVVHAGDVAVAPAGSPDGDAVLLRVGEQQVEDFVLVPQRPHLAELRYEVGLERVAGLRLVANTLELLDADGTPRLRVPPPTLMDARQRVHEAQLDMEGCAVDRNPAPPFRRAVTPPGTSACTLVLRWGSGVRYPVLVDPAWQLTQNDMIVGRQAFTMTALTSSDRILVAGGLTGSAGNLVPTNKAAVYDGKTNTWTATNDMKVARAHHAAALKPIAGSVYASGGYDPVGDAYLQTSERWHIATGTWALEPQAMPSPRGFHRAVKYRNNEYVILVGGKNATGELATVDVYAPGLFLNDPWPFTFTEPAPKLVGHLAFADIKFSILVVGGFSGGVAQTAVHRFNTSTRKWSVHSQMLNPRGAHAGVSRPTVSELVAVGGQATVGGPSLATAEYFNGSKWVALPNLDARSSHAAVELASGMVLVAAGERCSQLGATVECSALSTTQAITHIGKTWGTAWSNAGDLAVARVNPQMVALSGNSALIAGGTNYQTSLVSSELFGQVPLGGSCSGAGECSSGFCASGICCTAACTGSCQSCDAALTGQSVGDCKPVLAGKADPAGACQDQGPTSCGTNGLCTGASSCAFYPAATICGPPTCQSDALITFSCDGKGTCAEQPPFNCKPNKCDAGNSACGGACTTSAECASSAYCNSKICTPKSAKGAACVDAATCLDGFCVDGVCCSGACGGQCEACDVVGSEGTCTPVVGAPHAARPACAGAGTDPCSEASCDGVTRDACKAFVGTGTPCRAASCAAGEETLAASCEGSGSCPAEKTRSCAPYVCGADACLTTCSGDTDCLAPSFCDVAAGKCVSGATCDGDHTVTGADGKKTDCTPYRCDSSGECRPNCASGGDCVSGFICSATKTCVKPPAGDGGDEDSGCGCRTAGSRQLGNRGGGARLAGLMVLLFAGWFRRRRKAA